MSKIKLTKEKAALVYSACTVLGEKDLPIWFTIVRNLQELEEPIKAYDKAKQSIIEKLSSKDKDGKPVLIGGRMIEFGANKVEAERLFEELSLEEIELNLKTAHISKIKDFVLSPNVIKPLIDVVLTGITDDDDKPETSVVKNEGE